MEINSEVRALWRWYLNGELANRNKPPCEGECEYGLITPENSLLSFQIFRDSSSASLTSWVIRSLDGVVSIDLTTFIPDLIQTHYFDTVDYFVYNASLVGNNFGVNFNNEINKVGGDLCGFYYSEITDGTNTWTSEVFKFSANNDCRMRIEWTNSCGNIDNIYYGNGFINTFFLDAEAYISDPKPKLITVNTENGEKEVIEDFRRIETEYTIEFGYHPAYVIDALAKMLLCDTITVYLKNNLGASQVKLCKLKTEWDEVGSGCFAQCELTFQIKDAAINNPCCVNFEEFCSPYLLESDPGEWFFDSGWSEEGLLFCHIPGNTDPLVNNVPTTPEADSLFKVKILITGSTAGSVDVSIRGGAAVNFTGNGLITHNVLGGSSMVDTERFIITPTFDFDGCVDVSNTQIRMLCPTNFEREDDGGMSLRDDGGGSVLD